MKAKMKAFKQLSNLFGLMQDFKNWHKVLLNRLGVMNSFVVKCRKSSLRFQVRNRSDSHIIQSMFKGKCYNRDFIKEIFKSKKNNVIVDVGGHIGTFSFLIDSMYPGNQFYIFEPDNYNYSILEKNIKLNDKKKFLAIHKCVSSKNTRLPFFSCSSNNKSQSSSIINRDGAEKYMVDSTTIPSIMAKYHLGMIDLLKLDCEGAEFEIIKKMPSSCYNKIRNLIFEYHEDVAKQSHNTLLLILKKRFKHVTVKPHTVDKSRGVIYAMN
jgi:FkbM family methyltransferase